MTGRMCCVALVLVAAGCATEFQYDRAYVSQGIQERGDCELGEPVQPGMLHLAPGVSLENGLSEDEAVAVALWNNPQFQADLAALGFARADMIEANMLANPVFSLFFPVGPKLLETKLNLPIDVLWQRSHRKAAAKADAQRLAESLIEHGLGLIRDVQATYADLWLAQQRAILIEKESQIRGEMAEIAKARLKAGDVSELEASVALVDSLQATDAMMRASTQVSVLKQRLSALLGLPSENVAYEIVGPDPKAGCEAPVDELLTIALAARPDLRAAELAIEAAGQRVGWERSRVYNFIAIVDGKDKGEESLTVGPGFQVELPILNQNNGRIARAKAELEQAARQYEAVRQTILSQVKEAHTGYLAACEQFELWSGTVVPSLEMAGEQAKKSLAVGETSYLSVLEANGKLLEARQRQRELAAQMYRAAAQLNYCVGRRVI